MYQSGFAPNTQWTEEFAQGHEIRDYWKSVAQKYNVYQYLRLQQQVESAEWVPEKAKWKVTLQDLTNSKVSFLRTSPDDVILTVADIRRRAGHCHQCYRPLQRLETPRLPRNQRVQRGPLPLVKLGPQR